MFVLSLIALLDGVLLQLFQELFINFFRDEEEGIEGGVKRHFRELFINFFREKKDYGKGREVFGYIAVSPQVEQGSGGSSRKKHFDEDIGEMTHLDIDESDDSQVR